LSDASMPRLVQAKHPSRIPRDYYLAGVLVVAFGVFYFLAQSWTEELLADSTDILFIAVSGACCFLGFQVVRKWGFRGKFGVVHSGLFLCILLWLLHVDVPYPSLADLFYLAGYFPAFLGMGQFLWFFRKGFTPRKLAVVVISALVIVCSTSVVLLYPLMTESADTLTKLFDIGYPLLDTVLIVFAVMMALAFGRGRFAGDWLWITLGMILQGAADIAFSYGTLTGWYYSGHPIELLYVYGYIALGLGFARQTRSLTRQVGDSSVSLAPS
jgi:hypothetical protein